MPRFDVTIAGELNLDLILYGLPREIALERELLAGDLTVTLGSSSAIAAHNLAALGSKVGFISCIGDDALGEIALERLRAGGVDVSCVRRLAGRQTGLSIILQRQSDIPGDVSRTILTYLGTIADLSAEHLDLDYLRDSRHFHFCSYFLQRQMQKSVPDLFRQFRKTGMTVSLDCNDDPDDQWDSSIRNVLPLVDVFLPNDREARKIMGCENAESAAERLAETVKTVVVKRGTHGALGRSGDLVVAADPYRVNAVDAVGAGDSFDAGFIHQFVKGSDLRKCLRSGNRAGALSVSRPGGTEAFRDRAYVEQFLREHPID